MLRKMHDMPMARQVNVDECKLSVETLKSLNKEEHPEEQEIFRELYLELEEIDRQVSRTRSRPQVIVRRTTLASRARGARASVARGGRASTTSTTPRTYVRRGSGSGSCEASITTEDVPILGRMEHRDPEFDDEGNLFSDGDYRLHSSEGDDNDSSSSESGGSDDEESR
ncbi:hypothetical protein L7F22_012317 [Adiantum nelumboides]|nr:hypothetical protein [Adiantum nelumboides]